VSSEPVWLVCIEIPALYKVFHFQLAWLFWIITGERRRLKSLALTYCAELSFIFLISPLHQIHG
jgi:hypothetical protein